MVKLNNQPQGFANQTNQNQAFNQPNSFNQSQNQSLNNQLSAPNKGLFQIPEKYLQLIPWIPVGLEILTGQKIPATGVLADILNGIQSLQTSLSQVLTNQQQLWNKLESLENNASTQFNNLNQQVNNFKLLATKTERRLEVNSQPRISESEPNENEYQ